MSQPLLLRYCVTYLFSYLVIQALFEFDKSLFLKWFEILLTLNKASLQKGAARKRIAKRMEPLNREFPSGG